MKLKQILTAAIFSAILVPTVESAAFSPVTLEDQVETKITYTFNLGNITSMSKEDIEKKVVRFLKQLPKDNEPNCDVIFKGSVQGRPSDFKVELTVSGTSNEIRQKGKKIAGEIFNDFKAGF